MKLKCWFAIFVIALVGCGTTSSYQREHEVSANLPRAQGLGAFVPSCIFFCFATANYTHGDDTIDANATEALMHSRLNVQQGKSATAMVIKKKNVAPKPNPPKESTP